MSRLLHHLTRRAPFFATMLGLAEVVGVLVYYVYAQSASRSSALSRRWVTYSEELSHIGLYMKPQKSQGEGCSKKLAGIARQQPYKVDSSDSHKS